MTSTSVQHPLHYRQCCECWKWKPQQGGRVVGHQLFICAGCSGNCAKCGAQMQPGKAIAQTYSTGTPDFPGDSVGMTVSPGGPGKLIDCMKCPACGWSVTKTQEATN